MLPGIRAALLAVLVQQCLTAELTATASPSGLWKCVDDKTGKPRGTVRVYENRGEFFARIESSLDPKEASEVCELCPGDRKNQPIIGLVIMRRMQHKGEEYVGGDIIDPDTGVVYRCKFRMVENGSKLIVRGFIGFSLLGRSQVWLRVP